MNMIWQSSGCDARIVTYGVRATGERVGAIEKVPGCTSLGKSRGPFQENCHFRLASQPARQQRQLGGRSNALLVHACRGNCL